MYKAKQRHIYMPLVTLCWWSHECWVENRCSWIFKRREMVQISPFQPNRHYTRVCVHMCVCVRVGGSVFRVYGVVRIWRIYSHRLCCVCECACVFLYQCSSCSDLQVWMIKTLFSASVLSLIRMYGQVHCGKLNLAGIVHKQPARRQETVHFLCARSVAVILISQGYFPLLCLQQMTLIVPWQPGMNSHHL